MQCTPTVARVASFTIKQSRQATIARWQAAPATDIVAYLVYRGAKRLNRIAVPAGRISYSVRLPHQQPGRYKLGRHPGYGARILLASTRSRR